MELILLQDVEKVGRKGEVIRVRDGFGRNFLLPQNLALVATKENRRFVDDLKARAAKRAAQEKAEAETLAKKIQGVKITLERAAGEQDKLFGSVTAEDIREALAEKKHAFDKKQIHLKEPIRHLGTFSVTLELYPQVKAAVSVEVVAKS
ncbi:MAG: 50S ribosomal protein L9 [Candidatus Omnitrophica bacterium]|nr:50S ribosomal protein L9 [Candidatus Omnitrophota bacterium]